MPLLLQTENPSPALGIRDWIRHARPTHRPEEPMLRIPESDRGGATVSLIPGPVDQGRFRDDPVTLPPMPADQDILTCGECLGGTAHAPAATAKAHGILLHEAYHIPRPLVNNICFLRSLDICAAHCLPSPDKKISYLGHSVSRPSDRLCP